MIFDLLLIAVVVVAIWVGAPALSDWLGKNKT